MNKIIDIIIISYNTCELTLNCIRSIYDTSKDIVGNIVVVDNNSNDDTVTEVQKNFQDVKVIINPENYGYAKAVNIGFSNTSSDLVLVSNPDVIFLPGSIKELINTFFIIKNCGICGPAQVFSDGNYQRSFGNLPGIYLGIKDVTFITHIEEKFRKFFQPKRLKKVAYVDGAVMLINRNAYSQVGGFDEDYFFYTEEADFCFKLYKMGYLVIHNPKSKVIHYRGATENIPVDNSRIKLLISSKALFCKKHLSFNEAKFFMILEIIYSYNLWLIYTIISLINFWEKKPKNKKNIFKLFGECWLKEFTNFLEEN